MGEIPSTASLGGRGERPTRLADIAMRALPQAEAPSLRQNLSEIHPHPILRTGYPRHHIPLDSICVPSGDEVSVWAVVVDKATGHRADIGIGLRSLVLDFQENLGEPHLSVVLMAERANSPSLVQGRHAATLVETLL